MKKMFKLLAFFMATASLIVIEGCKEDDPPIPPTLTPPSAVASVQVGTKADVTFTFTAAEGFVTSTVTATGGTATVKTQGTSGATEGSVVVEFTADNSAGAGTVTLTITDAKDQTISQTATLNKTISAPPTVALSATSGSGNPGAAVTVTATVTAPNGINTLTYTTTNGLTGSPTSPITLAAEAQVLTFTIPATAAVGTVMTAVITATDDQNLNSTPVTFTVTASATELTGTLSADMTLNKGVNYLVKGQFIVPTGKTLTVNPGAVVKGDKATKGVILIQPGGKLMAVGTAAEPIVFTSAQPVGERDRGDWGGIVWLGDAYVNQSARPAVEGISPAQNYGTVDASQASATVGNNTQDNGKLKYARIEYAGIELTPNNETNTLTMGALGSATEIDYVQASYGGDDAFEWFGGTVNAKHLISLSTWDDDLDTDFGWRGNVQWVAIIRNPFFADQSGSTAFESDSQGNGNAIGTICNDAIRTGCTAGVFSNVSVFGPRDFNNGLGSNQTSTRSISANYTRAMHIRRRSSISIFNSFIAGFGAPTTAPIQGLQMDDAGTIGNFTAGSGALENNVLLYPDASGPDIGSNSDATAVRGIWEAAGAANTTVKPTGGAPWSPNAGTPAGSINPYTAYGINSAVFFGGSSSATYPSNPNFAVGAGSLTGLVATDLFADSKLTSGFFDTSLTYKGAFGATDWTDGWAEFQPLNKAY